MEIYDDLNSVESETEQYKIRIKELEELALSLNNDIERLCEKLLDMKDNITNLNNNLSTLYLTSKAEIARKDRRIAEMRTELDNMIFRKGRHKQEYVAQPKPSSEKHEQRSRSPAAKRPRYHNRESSSESRGYFEHSDRFENTNYRNNRSSSRNFRRESKSETKNNHCIRKKYCTLKQDDLRLKMTQNGVKNSSNIIIASEIKMNGNTENIQPEYNAAKRSNIGIDTSNYTNGNSKPLANPTSRSSCDHVNLSPDCNYYCTVTKEKYPRKNRIHVTPPK